VRNDPRACQLSLGTQGDDGVVVEGYVDLIFRQDDGSLVIVDYQTDSIPDGAVPFRTRHYRPQLEAYRGVLTSATDVAVATRVLFLRPMGSLACEV